MPPLRNDHPHAPPGDGCSLHLLVSRLSEGIDVQGKADRRSLKTLRFGRGENGPCSATTNPRNAALPFVISTEAQRSGEIRGLPCPEYCCGPYRPYPLPSRPKRTRISYFALLATTTCAALRKESRMQIIKATGLHRKFGGAKWRDPRVSGPFLA